jgi:crotonobetainyl-CoA:carnitine CoA-transferase CaiB-like acyl-CoA transferase
MGATMAANLSIAAKGWFGAAFGGVLAGLLAAQLLGSAGAAGDRSGGQVIDRAHKGDRLTVAFSQAPDADASGRVALRRLMLRARSEALHEACEPPASPYVDPQLAKLPGRCLS